MFDVIEWYFGLSLLSQVLVGLAIVAIIVLVFIGVYYLLKGTGYVIYNVFKGIGHLFYSLFLGIYLLFEGLYYLITGKTREPKQEISSQSEENTTEKTEKTEETEPTRKILEDYIPEVEYYCSECGIKFSDKMAYQITSKGIAFCECCGKGFKFDEYNQLSLNTIPKSPLTL